MTEGTAAALPANEHAPSEAALGPVGKRVRRRDGAEQLTGRARYTSDISLPGMLHVAVTRSPHPHARIRSVDTEPARSRDEVHVVLAGEEARQFVSEVPHSLDPAALGGNHAPIRILAVDKVVYAGEPVAAIVADTEADALAAAAAVDVLYEPLPHVLDAGLALAPGAPLVYEDWGTNLIVAGEFGSDDFDEVARHAPHVLAGELAVHRGNAAPIEPRAFVADWDAARERLVLHATTQNPHALRSTLAGALDLGEHQIRVIAPYIGGSFGLKMYGGREEFLVSVLARLAGRPVKWVEDRAAALLPGAHEQTISYDVAFDDDGRLLALDVAMVANHGPVANGHGWGMALVGAMTLGSGYLLEHCHVTYRVVATNKAPWGGTKPFGKDGATVVMERVMDLVAQHLGIDPAAVRRRNFVPRSAFPHVHTSGFELDSGDYEGALDLALARCDYARARTEQRMLREQGRCVGIGVAFELVPENADVPGSFVSAFDTSTVRMTPSGEVTVLTGVTSPGSGSDTGIAQLVGQELGVPLDAVAVVQGDTDVCPFGFGNISSRSIVTGGSSAILAAREIAAKLRTVAAAMLESENADIVLADGIASVRGSPQRAVPIAAVSQSVSLAYVLAAGVEPQLEATRTFRPANIRHVRDERGRVNTYSTFPYGVHVSVIEVDADTGIITVKRHIVAHDCGTIVNSMLVDGQVVGGSVMGLSSALGEEFTYGDDGRPLSVGFKTYLMARASDLPSIELEHQVTPSPATLIGAKGVGEAGYSGAQAALLGAVNDALHPLGARLDRLPASPPSVLSAIRYADG